MNCEWYIIFSSVVLVTVNCHIHASLKNCVAYSMRYLITLTCLPFSMIFRYAISISIEVVLYIYQMSP